jgi:hypothetical protein
MPIYKYKSLEEAEWALWNFNPDETYFRKVAALWNLANRILPISYPKGIFKFRSMEEANNHRDQCELERARKIQKARCSSGRTESP